MNKLNLTILIVLLLFTNIFLAFLCEPRVNVLQPRLKNLSSVLGVNNFNDFVNTKTDTIIQTSYLKAGYKDYRAFVLDKYFEKYNSPLKGYGDDFIVACEKYDLTKDCTVIPAIAYVETGLCTLALSEKQFNCWGFGGSDDNRIIFKSFSESIDYVTNRLASGYGLSLFNPVAIAHVYCGPNCLEWGDGVKEQRLAIKQISKEYNLPEFN